MSPWAQLPLRLSDSGIRHCDFALMALICTQLGDPPMVPKLLLVAGCQLPVKHLPTSTSNTHPFHSSITRAVTPVSVVVVVWHVVLVVAAAAVAATAAAGHVYVMTRLEWEWWCS